VTEDELFGSLVGRQITRAVRLGKGTMEITVDDGRTVEFEAWWSWGLDDGGLEVVVHGSPEMRARPVGWERVDE